MAGAGPARSQVWDPGRVTGRGRLAALARLVRVEHTLFSLPFAYAGAALASCPSLGEVALITVALVGLRAAAMAYNNIADLDIDRVNPRTRGRPLPSGAVSLGEAWALVVVGSLVYFAAAAALNVHAALLSPLLWLAAITYPHAKRHHSLPHLHLGAVLGSVVLGGAIASFGDEASTLAEALGRVPWLYVAAVTLWVSGFDTIYSIMDYEFDRRMGLGSLAAKLGPRGALYAAALQHAAAAALALAAAEAYGLGPLGWASTAAAVALIALEHALAWRGDVRAAFNLNLAVALVLGVGVAVDAVLPCMG